MRRPGVTIGCNNVGLDLVAVNVRARAGVVDRVEERKQAGRLVALPERGDAATRAVLAARFSERNEGLQRRAEEPAKPYALTLAPLPNAVLLVEQPAIETLSMTSIGRSGS